MADPIRVRVALTQEDAEAGRSSVGGAVEIAATSRRREVDDDGHAEVVLPVPIMVPLKAGGELPVVSLAVDDAETWAWTTIERVSKGRGSRTTFTLSDVTRSTDPEALWDVDYVDLTLLDPKTLEPVDEAETYGQALAAETDARETADNARLVKAQNLADLTDAAAARTNLGLGTAAVEDAGAFATSAQGAAGAAAKTEQDSGRLSEASLNATIASVAKRGGRAWIVPALGQSNNVQSDTGYPVGVSDERIAKYAPTAGITTMPVAEITLTASFARELIKTLPPTDWIIVVPTAIGSTQFTEGTQTVDGTSVTCSWDPDNTTAAVNLYDRAVTWVEGAKAAAEALGSAAFIAAVTFSGFEGDTPHLNKSAFTLKLATMISQFRTHFGDSTIPWLIGSLVPEYADLRGQTYTADVQAALAEIPGNNGVSLAAYFYGPRGYAKNGEVIHYSAAGQIERGKLAFGALIRAKQNRLSILPLPVPNLAIYREASGRVTATWEPPSCRVTGYTVEFSFDGGTTWLPGNLDPDSRLKATSAALPWESAQARVITQNSGAATTTSVAALSRVDAPVMAQPDGLISTQKFTGNEVVALSGACSLVSVYTLPASGGDSTISARTDDFSRQLYIRATQALSLDAAQAQNGAASITASLPTPKAAPGSHVTVAALSSDAATLRAVRDNTAIQTATGAAGTFTAEVLKVTATGGAVQVGAYVFAGASLTDAQMEIARDVMALRHGVTMPA